VASRTVNQGLGTQTNDTFDLLNFATAGFVGYGASLNLGNNKVGHYVRT
jgi:hypothetical protein